MRQEQEAFRQQFRLVDRGGAPDGTPLGADTNSHRGWNRIDTSGETGLLQRRPGETHSAGPLHNQERWRFWTRRVPDGNPSSQNDEGRIENNRESRKQEVPHKTDVQKTDGFEPFLNQEFKEEDLFVNNYSGNFSQQMELNRTGVEEVLKIAHLNGQVTLGSFVQSRSRSEAQGDELVAKRFGIFDKRTQKVEEENPYKRVVSVPEGWKIEINDTRITEELRDKEKLTGRELQRTFINRFNIQLKEALKECVWREKCSSEKDRLFMRKVTGSLAYAVISAVGWTATALINLPLAIGFYLGCSPIVFGIINILNENKSRRIDHPLEYFMPPVEIDKVARTYAYLAGKGRRLVREVDKEG